MSKGGGPQRIDHGGNFFQTPRRVIKSIAWKCLGLRARAVLQLFQTVFNGFNNGDLALGVHTVSEWLGTRTMLRAHAQLPSLSRKGFSSAPPRRTLRAHA